MKPKNKKYAHYYNTSKTKFKILKEIRKPCFENKAYSLKQKTKSSYNI